MKLCSVEPLKANNIIKGWRIVTPSGAVILATTRAEAERFANFVNDELTHLTKMTEAHALVAESMKTIDDVEAFREGYATGMANATLYCCERCQAYKERGLTS